LDLQYGVRVRREAVDGAVDGTQHTPAAARRSIRLLLPQGRRRGDRETLCQADKICQSAVLVSCFSSR
jgi:hypothetical protein